ncbi:MAG: hypothetical protein P8N60_11400 [Burkholderiaceae bacterium]|nr:hypothetical protein [Burkholderiaceae bacterium]
MSQQLDLWGMRTDLNAQTDKRPNLLSQAPPVKTYSGTLKAATSSYLVPWFEALALASMFRSANTITTGQLDHVLATFGTVEGHNFQSWWASYGFERFGRGLTDVHVSYPTKRGGAGLGVAQFTVSMGLSAVIAQEQMIFIIEQLTHFETGQLSSSPMLWHSFKCALTVQRLCLYLRILRAVVDLPEDTQHKILTVGKELNLVPKQRVGTYDLAGDRADKQKAIVHLTYDYFQKGRALVINAARGDFPNVVMPKEFVKARRPSRKLTAKHFERWGG